MEADDRLLNTYEVGPYTVKEFVDTSGDNPYYYFMAYVDGQVIYPDIDFDSLDEALVAAVAYRYEGVENSPAAWYFLRMIGAKQYGEEKQEGK